MFKCGKALGTIFNHPKRAQNFFLGKGKSEVLGTV